MSLDGARRVWPVAAVLLLPAASLTAQEPADTLLGWSGEAELSGSLFFGNTDQKVLTTRTDLARRDSTTELRADVRFSYGEATRPGEAEAFVTTRSWLARTTGEYLPFNRVSPFALASVESSFEKRIDVRYNGGAGVRVSAVETPRSTVSWSAALLGEHTRFDEGPGGEPGGEEELLRWAASLRLERTMADGDLTFRSETSYRPELEAFDRFTLSSTSSLSYALSDLLSVKLTFVDDYDSQAEARGAESNNDGRLVVGLLSTF